jgi:aminoglycoside phosphotransferase (APT) family kinase protein
LLWREKEGFSMTGGEAGFPPLARLVGWSYPLHVMDGNDQSTERLASAAAAKVTGRTPIAVHRFPTGLVHHVFNAIFPDRSPIVVRIGDPPRRAAMAAGLRLHNRLRALGVRLPEVIAAELNEAWPYVVLERLDGTDLGNVIGGLSNPKLANIAARIAAAQAIAARMPSAGRYGYATEPDQAKGVAWSHVLDAHLARSRARIAESALFDQSAVNTAAALLSAARAELDALPAVPFLHDTTTKNVIVTAAGTFSGIVDVDELCFGDPRYAPALTLASLLASDGPIDYVKAWMQQAGYRDDRIFRLYVALFLVDFMSEHGQVFNGNQPQSHERDRTKLTRSFGEVVSRIGTADDP